jgi:hypothetical protein
MADSPLVFLSIGRPQNDLQRQFKRSLMNIVSAQGFSPRTVGRETEDTDKPSVRSVDQIKKILSKCDGAVVVAYERNKAESMVLDSPGAEPRDLIPARLPTAWNHAEAAMAYFADLPILLLREKGVWTDSFLVDGVLGSVGEIEIKDEALITNAFQGQLASWAQDVRERHRSGVRRSLLSRDVETLTLRDLGMILSGMSWKSLLIIIPTFLALFGFVFGLGNWVGHLK